MSVNVFCNLNNSKFIMYLWILRFTLSLFLPWLTLLISVFILLLPSPCLLFLKPLFHLFFLLIFLAFIGFVWHHFRWHIIAGIRYIRPTTCHKAFNQFLTRTWVFLFELAKNGLLCCWEEHQLRALPNIELFTNSRPEVRIAVYFCNFVFWELLISVHAVF